MQVLDPLDTFLVEDFRGGGSVEVEVSSEDLVGSFTGEDHLDTTGLDLSAVTAGLSAIDVDSEEERTTLCSPHQVHGQRSSDGGHIKGLQSVDTFGQSVQARIDTTTLSSASKLAGKQARDH